ncbi:GH116 family glycosyl-hydrolase [Pseudovibrio sp. Tun.PSC04-5.I4]|uniref:GH116 family glycosyl-hydrolase n=1 Tax=Pseudovibrio sp. Tun.PSC04-5.I4 TaxID=1798213 RepID=UPI000889A4ED|nr:GH116 family glycosyl-hydrolase [Pseudovibrio sp. Tun.PSC04-5.I4]SDR48449.1 Uncharacterized protein, contains GBA2_N and DUF608 domains [Pseudovibrio sp. Tun.PSC04-5.I4]
MTRISDKTGFVYTNENTRHIAFPLGGIGTGGFALTGSGRLVDWSIRNRSNLLSFNGISNFAIKVERGDELIDARLLHGPYDGLASGSVGAQKYFDGFGIGANRNSLAGVPHFSKTVFTGSFPTASLQFEQEGFPADVSLQALSPFIPHNDRDSSMPVAMFEFSITNTTQDTLDFVIAGTLANHENGSGLHTAHEQDGISSLYMTSALEDEPLHRDGGVCIATDAERVETMAYGYRGQWFDELGTFWRDFAKVGCLPHRHYDKPRTTANMFGQPEYGTVAARVTLQPGESHNFRFVISWFYPNGDIYWAGRPTPNYNVPEGEKPTWLNYYATQWTSASNVATDALRRWDNLSAQTLSFRDALFGTTLPSAIKDAASSTLALLRTPTVHRLEGGELWAWEGSFRDEGSCEGSCTHVWNYQQALPYLFPQLERSFRETELKYNQQPNGGLTFRQRLPLGNGLCPLGPCADGHFGAIIKSYRDWKICGDTEWLKPLWPALKLAIEYAWSAENPDKWDPEETGILWGKQHHTLDMEMFEPNSWLSSMYVCALLAGSQMASAMGDEVFATRCQGLGKKGAAFIDKKLFNGSYYHQQIDLKDKAVVERFANAAKAGVLENEFVEAYWSDENSQINYQMGQGCHTDQILGQWHGDMCGLDSFLSTQNVGSALQAIYANNYNETLLNYFNPGRVYAFEDEGGLALATWPDQTTKPAVPAPYSEEIWTGLEYMVASHLIQRGYKQEGLNITETARKRYDGARRNPYNEMECGSYYARSLSSYALVNAWSGFTCDMVQGSITFQFDQNEKACVFWASGSAWGQCYWENGSLRLSVIHGTLALKRLQLTLRSAEIDHVKTFASDSAIEIGPGTSAVFSTLKEGLTYQSEELING